MRVSHLQQKAHVFWRTEPRLLIVCLVLVGLNLIMLLLGSYLLSPRILGLERAMIHLQAEVRGQGGSGSALSPQAMYIQAGTDLARVYEHIPTRDKLSDLVLDISSLARNAGIEVAHVSYKPEKIENVNLLGYTLSFTVNGSYRQLKKFIHSLESSPRIIILDSIGLDDSGSKSGEIALQLTLTTYFRGQEGA